MVLCSGLRDAVGNASFAHQISQFALLRCILARGSRFGIQAVGFVAIAPFLRQFSHVGEVEMAFGLGFTFVQNLLRLRVIVEVFLNHFRQLVVLEGTGAAGIQLVELGCVEFLRPFLAESTAPKEKDEAPPKNDYQLAKDRKSALVKAKNALKRAEERVHAEEEKLKGLEQKAGQPEIASDFASAKAIYQEMDEQRQRIENCYAEWEKAEEEHSALLEEDDEAK